MQEERMKNRLFTIAVGVCAVMMTLAFSMDANAKTIYKFGGGPAGGTFQFMAGGISTYPPVKAIKEFRVLAGASGGSVENLRKVNSGAYSFGVVYSGHVYQGRNGLMKNDTNKYENVLGVGYLYGAPAQLVVKKGSGIKSVKDLVGKKVGVGNAGSGAFANCELFFSHMGVWDKIERNAMGYNDAAAAFGNNQLDAFWLFVGYPTGAVTMAAQQTNIEMVDLAADAKASGFFDKYPYFSQLKIPAGTYKGVDYDVPSFQDSALWVANAKVPADVVYTLLSKIYTPEGLAHMVNVKSTAKAMSVEGGTTGIITPLHPGAEKFWKEKGVIK
jgi:TRAP transporter TAXI family solute receptor